MIMDHNYIRWTPQVLTSHGRHQQLARMFPMPRPFWRRGGVFSSVLLAFIDLATSVEIALPCACILGVKEYLMVY
jgi:hypothetical protein